MPTASSSSPRAGRVARAPLRARAATKRTLRLTMRSVCASCFPPQFPNLQAMANCGSLPLGAIFEPFAPSAPAPPRLRREPVRCQICGAFANRFCSVDAHNGRWVCVFCGASSFCRDYVGQDRAVRPSRAALAP